MSVRRHRQRRNIVARVSAAAVTVVLAVVTLAGLAYLAPSVFGYERYVITGGSMSGTFEKGSIAFEKTVPVADLRVGDIITYRPPADSGVPTLVTHRIVAISTLPSGRREYRTKGDANPQRDPWTFQLVNGRQAVVRMTVPHVGWILVGLADRDVRMVAVGVPAGLVALLSLIEVVRVSRTRPDDFSTDVDLPSSFRGDRVDRPSLA